MQFTKEQLSVISAPESNVIVNASAGTGKTTTLIGAAEKAIYDGVKNVVVFTLTRAAANELSERFRVLPSFVGTIHSFSLRELKKIEKKGIHTPVLMTRKEVRSLLLEAYMHFYDITRNYKETISDIEMYMNDRSYQVEYNLVQKYERVIAKYNSIKEEKGLYDYNDTPKYLLKIIKEKNYKLEYGALFVDEVQDIDENEFNLINCFNCRTLLIGDPKQTIFQFRNSFSRVFDKFEEIGYNLYILTKNYRSYSEILKYAGSWLDAARGDGGSVHESGILLYDPDVVVLCRYNKDVNLLSHYFENVYTIHGYKGLEADNVVIINFRENDEETRNLMFVAKTRARDKVDKVGLNAAIAIGRNIKYGL